MADAAQNAIGHYAFNTGGPLTANNNDPLRSGSCGQRVWKPVELNEEWQLFTTEIKVGSTGNQRDSTGSQWRTFRTTLDVKMCWGKGVGGRKYPGNQIRRIHETASKISRHICDGAEKNDERFC